MAKELNVKEKYKYLYGPVSSWRLGRSLGVDLLSKSRKICTFNCVYCQLGRTTVSSDKREVFVPTASVLQEIKSLPASLKIDTVTFSGKGEPTLAKNLGEAIRGIRKIREERIAVITNASLMGRPDVRRDLALADFVSAKMDCTAALVTKVNCPMRGFNFEHMLKGLRAFRKSYRGRLALQVMLYDVNKESAREIAKLVVSIHPDEIHLNTPLRPSGVRPLDAEELTELKQVFVEILGARIKISTVYEAERKSVVPLRNVETVSRRGARS